jgi:hypothetical protein
MSSANIKQEEKKKEENKKEEKKGTVVLSRTTVKVRINEKEYNSVACSFKEMPDGMQNCVMNQISVTDNMIRDSSTACWKGIMVNCVRYKDPKKKFVNVYASHVMGKEIIGHVVLFSESKDFNSKMIADSINPPPQVGWLGLAKQMPTELKLESKFKTSSLKPILHKKKEKLTLKNFDEYNSDDEPEIDDEYFYMEEDKSKDYD